MNPTDLEILYADEAIVAVNKPAGLLVHRSHLAEGEHDVLVDRVRHLTGRQLKLVHRLDRATSGVTLLAESSQTAAALGAQFMQRSVRKRYLAICRGWPPQAGDIEHALDAPGQPQAKPARTVWQRLATAEVATPVGRYASARVALIAAEPLSGRYRQIRRHFKHISHHLVGDTSHGDGRYNRWFRIHTQVHRLMLHAQVLEFVHPISGASMRLSAGLDGDWVKALSKLGWDSAHSLDSDRALGPA